MTTLVKANTLTVGQLWRRSLSHIKDTELLDMTRVRSHSYTSLRDVVAGGSLPKSSNNHNYNHNQYQLNSYHSLPNMRHPVHMRNPLVEKAARAYLATAAHRHNNPNSDHPTTTTPTGFSSGFSSFLKLVRFPFGLFGGFTWFKQLTIKV